MTVITINMHLSLYSQTPHCRLLIQWKDVNLQSFKKFYTAMTRLARENSQHFTMSSLVSAQNDVWAMTAEILYWWHVTTKIWVVLLWPMTIVVTGHQYGISAVVAQTSHFMHTHLIHTPHYGQFALSLGKESLYIFYKFNLDKRHPVNMDTLFGPVSVYINSIWLYFVY